MGLGKDLLKIIEVTAQNTAVSVRQKACESKVNTSGALIQAVSELRDDRARVVFSMISKDFCIDYDRLLKFEITDHSKGCC